MEKTLNDPISGEEIKAIILQRVTDALNRDTTLYNDISYAGFTMKFQCTIMFLRSKTANTLAWGNGGKGEGVMTNEGAIIQVDYKTDQPDVARQEHNLPVPVMQSTPSGQQRIKVRIEKAK